MFPTSSAAELFWWFLVFHAVCDYSLQTEFMALGKNHRRPLDRVPWFPVLFAHSIIHGGAVALVSGHLYLGVLELIAHFATDYAKSSELFGSDGIRAHLFDQVAHVAWKILWVVICLYLT